MKMVLFAACGALSLISTAAYAQGVYVGPGGLEFDRGPRIEEPQYERRIEEPRYERRRGNRTDTVVERRSGGRHCRIVTIERENDEGDLVTRRIRRCN